MIVGSLIGYLSPSVVKELDKAHIFGISCRRVLPLSHVANPEDCNESCDNCKTATDIIAKDITSPARIIVQIVKSLCQEGEKASAVVASEIFRGSKSK
jgi:hypothetical protein